MKPIIKLLKRVYRVLLLLFTNKKDVKPIATFLFLAAIFFILLLISYCIPDEGIKLSNDFSIKFKTWNDIFSPDTVHYADISTIEALSKSLEEHDSTNTLFVKAETDTIRVHADSLKRKIHKIEFANGDKAILHHFFNALENKSKSQLVRIMHYGDSQIEGDRITSFLRNRLQKKFGGCGAGLIPAIQVYDFQYTIKQDHSENWKRYTIYGKRDTTVKHYRYGALAHFSRFSPILPDSIINDSLTHSAWLRIEKSDMSFYNVRNFYQCRMFYGYNKKPVHAEIYVNDNLFDSKTLTPVSNLEVLGLHFAETPQKIEIQLQGSDSPDIYGISLDGYRGVAVDNIAMRGCSGLIFTAMDQTHLKKMYTQLNTKLLILQFGGNMVPYLTEDFDFYEKRFYQQLMRLKKLMPDLAIIVIGVADMAKKDGEHFVSYPNIIPIRNAMKSATFKANYAYWDLFEAMGGENSMPSWVFAEPSLATSDFTHFNHRGARVIAEMFYNALQYEYNGYIKANSSKDLAHN